MNNILLRLNNLSPYCKRNTFGSVFYLASAKSSTSQDVKYISR